MRTVCVYERLERIQLGSIEWILNLQLVAEVAAVHTLDVPTVDVLWTFIFWTYCRGYHGGSILSAPLRDRRTLMWLIWLTFILPLACVFVCPIAFSACSPSPVLSYII